MTMPGTPISKRAMEESVGDSTATPDAPEENLPTPAMVDSIVTAINLDPMSPEITAPQVYEVIAAWHAAHHGEDLNTVRRDPVSGAIAVRVSEEGIHLWRVTMPDGTVQRDTRPQLSDWEKLTP